MLDEQGIALMRGAESSTVIEQAAQQKRAASEPPAHPIKITEPAVPVRQFVVRVPSRLDVMGGMSESFGALSLQIPVAEPVTVTVARRTDGMLNIRTVSSSPNDSEGTSKMIRLADLSNRTRQNGSSIRTSWELCILSTVANLLSDQKREADTGFDIVVKLEGLELSDSSSFLGVSAACCLAVAKATQRIMDPAEVYSVCRKTLTDHLGVPVGCADVACILFGDCHALNHCESNLTAVSKSTVFPPEFTIVGVDSGIIVEDLQDKWSKVRAASLMGAALIERIAHHENAATAGRMKLSQVSVADYVSLFRDRLPTKIRGEEFLRRAGDEDAELRALVEPDTIYKVRSRTEHHIYEHARSRQLVETLGRAGRTNNVDVLVDAGEILYASHWSFGQRCGLGSVQVDLLISLLKAAGPDAGFFGAKITGFGCGGLVAVLMHATAKARAALESVVEEFRRRSGLRPRILPGEHGGAMKLGVQVT